MSGPQDGAGDTDDLACLLNAAITRLRPWRRTFTEEEALASLWEAGYEVSPAIDGRCVLARESDGNQPRQWRLAEQALANDRLLGELRTGQWNGRDLDTALTRLDTVDHVHYVFCPLDPTSPGVPMGRSNPQITNALSSCLHLSPRRSTPSARRCSSTGVHQARRPGRSVR